MEMPEHPVVSTPFPGQDRSGTGAQGKAQALHRNDGCSPVVSSSPLSEGAAPPAQRRAAQKAQTKSTIAATRMKCSLDRQRGGDDGDR